MLEEQVQVLSLEQNRLSVLGQQEQGDRGLFGWLLGRLRHAGWLPVRPLR